MKEISEKIKKPFIAWIICLILFILLLILDIFIEKTPFKNFFDSYIAGVLAIVIVLGGVISFIFFLINSISYFFKKGNFKKRNNVVKILKIFLIILILPIILIIEILKPLQLLKLIVKRKVKNIFSKQLFKNFAFSFLIVVFLFPLWLFPFFVTGFISANALGFISSPIPLSGTGSMYPTFSKGEGKTPQEQAKEIVESPGMLPYPNGLFLFGKRYFNHKPQRGDIVIFQNKTTETITKKQYGEATGFAKRIIALPNDSIEIKNGLVYLNGKPLKEPYTAKPHSTFAEAFLQECKQLKVPVNKVFVMGDNRKGSGDSREFGFVDFKDINHILPLANQKGVWDKNWRDTGKDFDETSKIRLDKNKYLELLNEKRKEAGIKPLTYQPKLELSAFKRGKVILKLDDFSFEATKSAYTMRRAMSDAGYSNITYGEAPTQGYFEAEELIDNQFQFPKTKEFLLNEDNQEIGIAEVEGEISGCPTQVVVQHFAGYVPPNYTTETIDSWGRVINNMNEIIPSWEKMKNWRGINRDDLDRLLELLYKRKNNAEAIYYRMKANQWLTDVENQIVSGGNDIYNQIEILADKLNGK